MERVAPALSTKDNIPVYKCLHFDGTHVIAHNDTVALKAACPWDIDGCIPGEEFMALLKASNSRQELVAEQKGNEISIKLGRADAKLDVIPSAEFKFAFPPDEGCLRIEIDEDLIDCLKKTCVSAEKDEKGRGWIEGVTLAFDAEAVRLYACDKATASRARTSRVVPDNLVGLNVQLKTAFCRLLIDIDRDDYAQTLVIHDDWVQAEFESGLILHAQRLQYANPEQYEKLFSQIDDLKTVLVPAGFEKGVAKAASVIHGSDKVVRLSIEQDEHGPSVTFDATGERGTVHESVRIDGDVINFVLKCNPDHLKRALPFVDEFLICKTGVLFRGEDFDHIIGKKNVEDDDE